jgi:hypothetical protein
MRQPNKSILLFISIAWILPMAQGWAQVKSLPIDELLSDLQKVLIQVRDASVTDGLPALASIRLTLRATLNKEANGSLKFHILEANAKDTDENTQELRLQLEPPRDSDQAPINASLAPLADAIIDAAKSVKAAESRAPPLHLTTLEASVEFTVEKEASGSIAFFGGKAGNRNTQQIILTFGKAQ